MKTRKLQRRTAAAAAARPILTVQNGELVCLDGRKPDLSNYEGLTVNVIGNSKFRELVWKASIAGIA